MIGLLSALPNTQLTKRLGRERRLISYDHQWIKEPSEFYELRAEQSLDQTMGGLNFVTVRDRVDVYRQLKNIIQEVYHHGHLWIESSTPLDGSISNQSIVLICGNFEGCFVDGLS